MKNFATVVCGALIALVAALPGCGGGGGTASLAGGIGGTGKIASGAITGFGSIFVNGVEYDIDTASCSVDGSDVSGDCQANLAIGMVVTVEGEVNASRGAASRVVFNAYAEGPVSMLTTLPDGLTRTFSIMGVPVVVDSVTTGFDDGAGFGFSTLAEGNVVKLSGFVDAAGALQATYVRKLADSATPGSTAARLKGVVASLAGSGSAPGDSFTLNGTTVSVVAGTDVSALDGTPLADGDDVDVDGIVTGSASIDATRIARRETGIGEDGDDVSIEGLVAGFSGDLADFRIDGQRVDASNAQLVPSSLQLADGVKVEAEGVIVNGVLVAEEIEARGGNIRIDATVSASSADTLTLSLGFEPGTLAPGSITVKLDNQTIVEDLTGPLRYASVDEINPGDFVQVRGFQSDGDIVVDEVHIESPDTIRLQGPVEDITPGTSVTVLGVTFLTDGATEFEDAASSTAFYAALSVGDIVRIEDQPPGNGTADEIEQED